ncbi:hypothetical protein II810_00465, partial [bacterium]|nr:hypothetical protein [bacterium]
AGYAGISKSECNSLKSRLGINKCPIDGDRWAAAVKKCHDLGLHLPSEQTLATATGARYGRSDITKDTIIGSKAWVDTKDWPGSTCEEKIKDFYGVTDAICITKGKNGETVEAGNMYQDDNNAPIMLEGHYWLNIEVDSAARVRYIGAGLSNYFISDRDNGIRRALCVGD